MVVEVPSGQVFTGQMMVADNGKGHSAEEKVQEQQQVGQTTNNNVASNLSRRQIMCALPPSWPI
jgi:hypothetical protein